MELYTLGYVSKHTQITILFHNLKNSNQEVPLMENYTKFSSEYDKYST